MTKKENNQAIAAQIAQATFDLNEAVAQVNGRLSCYYTNAINGEFIQASAARDRVVSELVNLQETVEALLESFAEIGDVNFCND